MLLGDVAMLWLFGYLKKWFLCYTRLLVGSLCVIGGLTLAIRFGDPGGVILGTVGLTAVLHEVAYLAARYVRDPDLS